MSLADPTVIASLERRRSDIKACCISLLSERKRQGVTELGPADETRYRGMLADLQRVEDQLSEEKRKGSLPPNLQRAVEAFETRAQTTRSNSMSSYSSNFTSNVYRPGGTSYLRDLSRIAVNADDNGESRARLAQHADEVGRGMEHRDLSRVDGTGGYAVPPSWLMNQYVDLPRPGRAFANLVQRQPLPGGTDSINVPKILTGTKTGVQVADNTAIANQDLTDTFINAPVRTIAGEQSIALQLLDQSPVAFDEIVFADLAADHDKSLDQQCISGSGSNGEVLGVLSTPGVTSVVCLSLDIKGIYSAIANAIQTVHTKRFAAPTAIVMHPRRWGWLLSLLDADDRPLFCPSDQAPFNAAGTLSAVAPESVVGRSHGLPVITDGNLPTNLGAGGNEDTILVLRASDIVLWEGGVRMRALPEPKASTLTVVCQVYSYLAFSAARHPESVVQITGLTPPVWT